jgi:hypothetical protein
LTILLYSALIDIEKVLRKKRCPVETKYHCFGIAYRIVGGRLMVLAMQFREPVYNRPDQTRLRKKFPGGGGELVDVVLGKDSLETEKFTIEKILYRELQEEIGGLGFRVVSHEALLRLAPSLNMVKTWDEFEHGGLMRSEGELQDGEDSLFPPKWEDAEELHKSKELVPDHRLALEMLILKLARKGYGVARKLSVGLGLEPVRTRQNLKAV